MGISIGQASLQGTASSPSGEGTCVGLHEWLIRSQPQRMIHDDQRLPVVQSLGTVHNSSLKIGDLEEFHRGDLGACQSQFVPANILAEALAGWVGGKGDVDELIHVPQKESVQPRRRRVAVDVAAGGRGERSMCMCVDQLFAADIIRLFLPCRAAYITALAHSDEVTLADQRADCP